MKIFVKGDEIVIEVEDFDVSSFRVWRGISSNESESRVSSRFELFFPGCSVVATP